MGPTLRIALIAGVIVATVAGGLFLLSSPADSRRRADPTVAAPAPQSAGRAAELSDDSTPLYGDRFVDDSGYSLAGKYTGVIADRSSLTQSRDAYRGRGARGVALLTEELNAEERAGPLTPERATTVYRYNLWIASLLMADGKFAEADPWIGKAIAAAGVPGVAPLMKANARAMRGVAALRRGETENCVACVGPSSCIYPIVPEAVHQFPSGSRAALGEFNAYLTERPDDLGVRWLSNLASMTLGEYPDKVPPAWLVPAGSPRGKATVDHFPNVAFEAGLYARGPNMAGGVVFDDLDGDLLPDVFISSFDVDLGALLFRNKGDGTFVDRSDSPLLAGQGLAMNVVQADYDNDGDLDILVLRGGWENPLRLSLLRNKGDATFDDVTTSAGLALPIASHAAAWADFDNDGLLDLFVAGEYLPGKTEELLGNAESLTQGDPRNHCRLYKNKGDGTFVDVAEKAGVWNERFAKGCAWGDYDGDGRPDLYVSNIGAPGRLYHNEGDGTFYDVAPEFGLTQPVFGFTCWFWDYDNDGRLDLFASGYKATLQDAIADRLGVPTGDVQHPRLFRNTGPNGFSDETSKVGLDHVWMPMGAGFGDVDNDGFLDVYLSTGRPGYSFLVPNALLRNAGGKTFEDVTTASGTGHLQKGHGVSFADFDGDGHLDLFAELGGAVPGDRAYNALFRNPGTKNHWLKIKLVGKKTNRSGIGARVRVETKGPAGEGRSVYREIGNKSSYSGSSLVEHVGLGASAGPVTVTVTWPTSKTTQTFTNVAVDRFLEITEGADAPVELSPKYAARR